MSGSVPCRVVHVHLDEQPAAIEVVNGERSVLAIFWWRHMPLGSRLFTTGELPVPATAARILATDRISAAVSARLGVPEGPASEVLDTIVANVAAQAARVTDTISVVVCTRDRPVALARCLASLSRCQPAPAEIVVVDNAPQTFATKEVCDRFPAVRYVAEPAAGLSRARNRGIAAATGAIIAFTDDDVEVAPNWIEALRSGFVADRVGCVTGLVLPGALESEAAFTFETVFGGLGGSFVPRIFEPDFLQSSFGEAPAVWTIGAGANMAFRREIFDTVGLFDVRLGAGASGCSEDSEMWYRMLAAGYSCNYEPAAVVHHEHRGNLAALRSQLRAYMRGHSVALFVQHRNHRHPGNLVRVVTLPIWLLAVAVSQTFRPGVRRSLIGSELLGLAEGPIAWLKLRKTNRLGEKS